MLYACAATEAGGAVYMDSGTLDITDSELYVAKSKNGACVYSTSADVTVDGTSISGCGASSGGGGIFISTGDLTISDSDIEDNSATYGGAIEVDYGAVQISDTTIEGNSATTSGGGLFLQDGTARFSDVAIIDNEAATGGGLFLYTTAVTIDCATTGGVSANVATSAGGGAYIEESAILSTSNCNWGYRSDENDPDDVYLALSGDAYTDFDSSATFDCDGSTGACN